MPGMTWDESAKSQLLLSIIAVHDVKIEFDKVAALMGPNCTPRAVQEQIKKLKKEAAAISGGIPSKSSPTKSAKATAKAPTVKKPSKKKAKRVDTPDTTSDESDAGNVSDDEATPAKGVVNGRFEKKHGAGKKLGAAMAGVKRKAEEMDGSEGTKAGIKKEKMESDVESEEHGEEMKHDVYREEGDLAGEQLWAEMSQGIDRDGLCAI